MQKFKKYATKAAAWVMSLMMVMTTVNLPANAIIANAEEPDFEAVEEISENIEISEEAEIEEGSEEEISEEINEEVSEEVFEEAEEISEEEISEDEELSEEISEEEIPEEEEVFEEEISEDVEDEAEIKDDINKLTDDECDYIPDGDDYILVINGTGDWDRVDVQDGPNDVAPWYDDARREKTTKIVVDLTNATDISGIFEGFTKVESIDIRNLDTSLVTNMSDMFYGCESLKEIDLSGLDTQKVTNISYMFRDCKSLSSLDLSCLDTSNVSFMQGLCMNCENLETVNLSGLNAIECQSASNMFWGCKKLRTIDLSNFVTSNKLNSVANMFLDCINLEYADLSGIKLLNLSISTTDMLKNCPKLKTVISPSEIIAGRSIELPLKGSDDWNTINASELNQISGPISVATVYFRNDSSICDDMQKAHEDNNEAIVKDGTLWAVFANPYASAIYTGKKVELSVNVYDGAKLLTKGVDYTVSYKNNINAANATDKKAPTATIKGKGNYKNNTQTLKFSITKYPLTYYAEIPTSMTIAYTGKAQKPFPTVNFFGKKLTNKDIKVTYAYSTGEPVDSVKEPGSYKMIVSAKSNNFSGLRDVDLIVSEKDDIDLSKAKIVTLSPYKIGSDELGGVTSTFIVKYKGKELKRDTDYKLDFSYPYANVNAEYTAMQTKTGEYSFSIRPVEGSKCYGYQEFTVKVEGASIKKATITGLPKSVEYWGKERTKNYFADCTLSLGNDTLELDKDYEVKIDDANKAGGKITITFNGVGEYSGSVKKTVKIAQYDIYENEAGIVKDYVIGGIPHTYNEGKMISDKRVEVKYVPGGSTTDVTIRNYLTECELVQGKDYTISYKNNKKLSTDTTSATLVIKGKGNYKGTISYPIYVVKGDLSETTMAVADKKFANKAGNYKASVKLTASNGKALKAGTDFEKEVKYYYVNSVYTTSGEHKFNAGSRVDDKEIVAAGTYIKAVVTGKGNFEGTIQKVFRVTTADISGAKVTIKTKNYTGKAIILNAEDITVKVGGKKLVYGEDFTVVPGSYVNNVNKGKATVTIKGIGNYGGTKKGNFTIKQKLFNFFK